MKVAIFLVHCVAPYQPGPSTLVTTRSRAEIGFDQSKGRYPAGSALPFRQTLLARLLASFDPHFGCFPFTSFCLHSFISPSETTHTRLCRVTAAEIG